MSKKRFDGNGNTWVGDGHYRGWEVQCSKCSETQVVASHHGSSLPPEAVSKIFWKKGWTIGKTSDDDLCPKCLEHKKPERELPDIEYKVNDPKTYFKQLKACLTIAKTAVGAKQFNRAADYIESA